MYCINCGVRLADTEKKCPLCGTVLYHPDLKQPEGDELYPTERLPIREKSSHLGHMVLTLLFLITAGVVLYYDLSLDGYMEWSGYVIGALTVTYVSIALPMWFTRPNPVIFFPCAMASVCVYLLYISLATHGGWFLSFAFPVTGGVTLIVECAIVLMRYLRRGKLFIFGGSVAALGAFMLLTEFLMSITFESVRFIGWCFYPIIVLGTVGAFLIFLGICRPARESIERKVFF